MTKRPGIIGRKILSSKQHIEKEVDPIKIAQQLEAIIVSSNDLAAILPRCIKSKSQMINEGMAGVYFI